MVYDESRQEIVMFGGSSASKLLNDTWVWNGDDWVQRSPAVSPPARVYHGMAYDGERHVVVLFGGNGRNDTWTWDGTNWTQKFPVTSPPTGVGHTLAYDAAQKVVILPARWFWDGTNWEQRTFASSASEPKYVSLCGWAYHVKSQQNVKVGGATITIYTNGWKVDYETSTTTYILQPQGWSKLTDANTPMLFSPAVTYDSGVDRILLFGGSDWATPRQQIYSWDGAKWSKPAPQLSPSARHSSAMAFDPIRGQAILFGGDTIGGPLNSLMNTAPNPMNDTWVYNSVPRSVVPTTVSAASSRVTPVTRSMIVSTYGLNLALKTEATSSTTLPVVLGGSTVKIVDSTGRDGYAGMYFASNGQVNWLVPDWPANGTASITIRNQDGRDSQGTVEIASLAPGMFSANGSGSGLAAANLIRVTSAGGQTVEPVVVLDATGTLVPVPVDFGSSGDQLYLVLYATGLRNRTSQSAVTVKVGGLSVPVQYAGPQGDFSGLDQINIGPLPHALAGRGEINIALTADGMDANPVTVKFK
jgi:uncharacterized protein (TIGR03437 family)